jgi:hypothetical protein
MGDRLISMFLPTHDKTIADIEQLPERIRNQDGTAGAVQDRMDLIHS